jgi:hypothetical protein
MFGLADGARVQFARETIGNEAQQGIANEGGFARPVVATFPNSL